MLSSRDKSDLRAVALAAPISAAIGVAYAWSQGWTQPAQTLRGAAVGLLTGVGIAGFELFIVNRSVGRRLARLPFAVFVLFKTIVYLAIVGLAQSTEMIITPDAVPPGAGKPLQTFTFGFVVALMFNLIMSLDRLLGGGVLLRLLTGRYHRPKVEQRVLLLADVVDSSGLAARLGDQRFHAFLDDVFFDLGEPVLRHRGQIYRYVGDQAIITWRIDRGLHNADCVRCASAIGEALRDRAPYYTTRYGEAPRVRFALHGGRLVAGEMGDLKREIVLLGESVNTAAHIEQASKGTGRALVISADLLSRLSLPAGLRAKPLPDLSLKGRGEGFRLFCLEPTPSVDDNEDPADARQQGAGAVAN